uniref:Uncharacterized protein n=1 Tax=Oryza punctata TaxID=4537 RepID=A0A0E0LAD6_ORYPU
MRSNCGRVCVRARRRRRRLGSRWLTRVSLSAAALLDRFFVRAEQEREMLYNSLGGYEITKTKGKKAGLVNLKPPNTGTGERERESL